VIDDPEEQAQQNAEHETGNQGKGDRPSPSPPVEVAGESAQRNVKAVKTKHDKPRHDEEDSKEDQDAAEVRHETD
jgi:hypothetical protein